MLLIALRRIAEAGGGLAKVHPLWKWCSQTSALKGGLHASSLPSAGDSRFLARLAERSSPSDFARNDKRMRRSPFDASTDRDVFGR